MIRLITKNGHESDSFLDESQIHLQQLRNQKLKRCKMHPGHDPHNQAESRRVFITENCLICRGIHYGVQPAGSFEGESVVRSKHIQALTTIWPLSLAQFGLVRHRLAFNHYYYGNDNGGPKWSVDTYSRAVFINATLSNQTRKMFEEWGCILLEKEEIMKEEVIFSLVQNS